MATTLHRIQPTQLKGAALGSKLADGGGLYFYKRKVDAGIWVLRYTLYRRRHEMGLGSYPGVSLKEAREEASQRTGLPGTQNSVEILATPDSVTEMKGAQPRQLVISANTRESRIAAYLDGWKRRVERVGTMNFPRGALDQPGTRNPVLQVSIAVNGDLSEVIILTSSGNRGLDMAAVDILRMAAPFDRFPEYLRNDYDELKFSYEWQFTGNSVGRMTVP